MDIKAEIKEEVPFSEVTSQTERKSFSQDVTMKLNNDATVYNNVCQTVIKKECVELDFGPQNDKQFFSVVTVNQCNKDSELDTKIEIKEEMCWLEGTSTEASCVDDVTKDWVDESFPSTESMRFHREETYRDKPSLFCDENSGNNARFNMTEDTLGCEAARTYTTRELVGSETSSVQKSVSSKQYDGGQMVSKSSCLKYNDFAQQNSTQVHDLNKKNYCYKSVLGRNNIGESYKYEICNKRFTSPSALKQHEFIHESKKTYQCDVCEKCFTRSQNLKRHKLTHEGIKPHKCDICGKCFTQLHSLKTHILTHEGIKPHKCDTCGKCFTEFHKLKTHTLTHEGIKPHKCDTCGKCFAQLCHLKTHKLIHEGIKPHNCDTCGKCFISLKDLKRHKFTHEGIKPHNCDTCGKYFTQLSSLKRHTLTHEGIKAHM